MLREVWGPRGQGSPLLLGSSVPGSWLGWPPALEGSGGMFSMGLNLLSPFLVGWALGAHEMSWVMKHHPTGPPEKAWVHVSTAHVPFLSLSP